jgi:peptidyl-Asp metalloendopeptidase
MPTLARRQLCIPAIAAAGLLALCVLSGSAQAQTAAKPAKSEPTHEQVIITKMPAARARVRNFLRRLLGKSHGSSLETTGSEVLSVPKKEASRLAKRLEAMGAKVVRLRENWNHILQRHKDPVKMTPAQQSSVDVIKKAPETVNLRMVKMPDAAVVELALKGTEKVEDRFAKIVLPVSDDTDVTLVRTRPTVKNERGFTWTGEVEGSGERAVLMLWKDAHLSGYFGYQGRVFMINQVEGQVHAMAEVDPRKLPPDHAPGAQQDKASGEPATPGPMPPEPKVAPLPDAERQALEAKKITIDVMLPFSKNAAKHYIQDPADLLALAIEQANDTFRNSGLGNISLRLVHYQEIDYDEAGADQFDHLYRMVDGTGIFKDVKKLRDEKHADIVGLIIDNPSGCGQSTRVGADAEEAYFVVHHACAAITYSIAHEIGHILGARHDRFVDANNAPIPYAHGYINGTKWRDMMSYQEGCGGCARIPYWSNPRIMYKGEPTGTDASDNARVILEQAERVSKFR